MRKEWTCVVTKWVGPVSKDLKCACLLMYIHLNSVKTGKLC
jgi:hypothetical protein